MEKINQKTRWTATKLFAGYMLLLLLMLLSNQVKSQSPCGDLELCVVQFNAGFNEANEVLWVSKLKNAKYTFIDIVVDTKATEKYKIVVVPTILIFNNGKEVGRYQANIMMKIETEQKEIQNYIDELLMEDF